MGVKDDIARARAEFSQAKTQHTQRKQPGFELVPTSKRAAARSEHSVSAAGKANTTQLRCGLALLRCVAVSCAVASLASLTMVALGLDVGDELRAVRSRLHMDAALEQQLHCDRTLDTVAGRLDLRRQGEATGLCAPHAHSRTRARAVGSGSGSSALSFLVLGDFGRDGMCCQRDVALEMALAAKATKPQLVLNLGDAIYRSVPLLLLLRLPLVLTPLSTPVMGFGRRQRSRRTMPRTLRETTLRHAGYTSASAGRLGR